MIEGIKIVGKLVDIRADPVGGAVCIGAFHHGIKSGNIHHELLFHSTCRYACPEGRGVLGIRFGSIALENIGKLMEVAQ